MGKPVKRVRLSATDELNIFLEDLNYQLELIDKVADKICWQLELEAKRPKRPDKSSMVFNKVVPDEDEKISDGYIQRIRFEKDIDGSVKLTERIAIVLAGLDKAERKVYGHSRNYVKGKWYRAVRFHRSVTKKGLVEKGLKNKYYNTTVKITNYLYNRCSGTGNALQIVAFDYGKVIALAAKEWLDQRPFFLTGYSPTERNKTTFNKFIAMYRKDEGISYWKQRGFNWSVIYGHIKLKEQSVKEVKRLMDLKRVLVQTIESGEFMKEYDCTIAKVGITT